MRSNPAFSLYVRAAQVGDARVHAEHDAEVLHAGTYWPEPYRLLFLHTPKRRLIAAEVVRDRLVHHAVVRVLAPIFDPSLIDATYACLDGRGCHRALLAMVAAMRRARFMMLLDIRHYFLSIDREILIEDVMARKLKDRRMIELLRVIADSGAGFYTRVLRGVRQRAS